MTIRLIESFTSISNGVRIEGAPSLLSHEFSRNGNGNGHEMSKDRKANGKEFWMDVIGSIKAKHPHFVFVAGKVGPELGRMREVGFDYFENDSFIDVLVNQIRHGEVGASLKEALSGEQSKILKNSIFNLSPLIHANSSLNTSPHQNLLSSAILSLLPGVVKYDGHLPEDLDHFINRISRSSVVRKGKFCLLSSGSPAVLAFARWRARSLYIAVANFSPNPQKVNIKLDGLVEGFEENRLYLVSDALHGAQLLKNLLTQQAGGGPALALWGSDLRNAGLPLATTGLSLRLFSVNLTNPIIHDVPEQIHQLHKA